MFHVCSEHPARYWGAGKLKSKDECEGYGLNARFAGCHQKLVITLPFALKLWIKLPFLI